MNFATDERHPNHILIKALKAKGYTEVFLTFAPRFAVDYGWLLNSNEINVWMGFNKKEALKFIEQLPSISGSNS